MDHVRQWLATNTGRFSDHEDIKALLNSAEHLYTEMEVAVQPCGSPCASCHLSCLRPKNHPLQHDCKTSHACFEQCDMVEEHATPVLCGLPYVRSAAIHMATAHIHFGSFSAGHSSRHMCVDFRVCSVVIDLINHSKV